MATSATARSRPGPPSRGTGESGLRDRDEAVKAAWHALISAKVTSWNALERELGESHGLGVSDFEVLDYLAGKPDGCRSQSLADAVHLSQTALSRLDDRRGINLVLTDTGRDKHGQALRTYCEVLARTLPPGLITRFG